MIRARAGLRRLRLRLLPVPGQAVGLVVLVAVLVAALVSAPLMVASADEGAWEQRYLPSQRGTTVLSSSYTGDGQLPARLAGLPDPRVAALETLDVLRLGHLAERLPDEVSLGEQQRTALARALVDG
jgi:hypothetical protein